MASIHILNKQVPLLVLYFSPMWAQRCWAIPCVTPYACVQSYSILPTCLIESHTQVYCVPTVSISSRISVLSSTSFLHCMLVCIHLPQSHCVIVYTMHSYSPVSFLPLHCAYVFSLQSVTSSLHQSHTQLRTHIHVPCMHTSKQGLFLYLGGMWPPLP